MTQRANRRADDLLDDRALRAWLHASFKREQVDYGVLRQQTLTGRPCGIPGFIRQHEKHNRGSMPPNASTPGRQTKKQKREVLWPVPETCLGLQPP